MDAFVGGVEVLLEPSAFAWLVIGLVVGFVVGCLPGFEGSNAAALLLPLSVTLDPALGLLLMIGVFCGSQYGGSVPAILLNIPGTAASAATALDGHPMALQGRGATAVGLARVASTIGGVVSALCVLGLIGVMAELALNFRSPELFIIGLIGLVVIATLLGDDPVKGILSASLGLLIATMATSPFIADPRFTMGFAELRDSIPFIPVIIGVFAISEMLLLARNRLDGRAQAVGETGSGPAARPGGPLGVAAGWADRGLVQPLRSIGDGVRQTLSYPRELGRATFIGIVLGLIPGIGSAVANFISYGESKRRSKTPERYGKGAPEGVIAAEACDNATVAGSLVPTLTLGIPGSGLGAVLLASMFIHGLAPGPQLMQRNGDLVYALLLGVLVASALTLPIGTLITAPLVAIARARIALIIPVVILVSLVGAYAVRSSMFDAGLALVFGVLGVVMRQTGYPVIPMILGLIFGPILESNLLRSLRIAESQGLVTVFLGTPTAIVLWAMLLLLLIMLGRSKRRIRAMARVG